MHLIAYRHLYVIICLALSLGLTACASKKVRPPLAAQANAKNLSLSGRLSLVVEHQTGKKQATTLGFTLYGNAQKGSLQLRSPLGNTLGVATWSPKQAILQQGQKMQTHTSLEALLHRLIGAPIPTDALFDWLRGKRTAVAGWNVDLTEYSAGKIRATRMNPKPIAHLRVVMY